VFKGEHPNIWGITLKSALFRDLSSFPEGWVFPDGDVAGQVSPLCVDNYVFYLIKWIPCVEAIWCRDLCLLIRSTSHLCKLLLAEILDFGKKNILG
jgi:hypothetical protein